MDLRIDLCGDLHVEQEYIKLSSKLNWLSSEFFVFGAEKI